ncbi:hypothetical protein ACKKBG_A29130 [Auxenochlorella protothecoides x Auxenochlorella symbiontica]
MASHRRTPILFLTLLILSLGVLSKGACTSKVFSLPAVMYKTHVYMLEFNSADAFCESQGYSKAGCVRNSTLNTLDLPVSAVQMRPFKVLEARSTDIILSVECLKTGQTACATDEDGNTGAGKQGKNHIEDFHVSDWNIGEQIGGGGGVTPEMRCCLKLEAENGKTMSRAWPLKQFLDCLNHRELDRRKRKLCVQ